MRCQPSRTSGVTGRAIHSTGWIREVVSRYSSPACLLGSRPCRYVRVCRSMRRRRRRDGEPCRILKLEFGEVLLFFNYDGVNRIIGGIEAGSTSSEVLERLFGSADAVSQLLGVLGDKSLDRERAILAHFLRAIRARSGAKFFVPFRIEARARRTSHYLLHCSTDKLAFKIMKSVMDGAGKSEAAPYGRLEMLTERTRDQGQLFHLDIEAQKAKIVDRVGRAPCQVKELTEGWMYRPDDSFSERGYKQMLLQLEKEGRLVVWDKENLAPKPASKRRTRNGEATLGAEYWLRVPS